MKDNSISEKRDELLKQFEDAIQMIEGQESDAISHILAAVKLLKSEMSAHDLTSLEKFLDEMEFSLEMINYTPGRNMMEALLRGKEFLQKSVDEMLLDDTKEPDEADMNDILASIVTCHPDLAAAPSFCDDPMEIQEEKERSGGAESRYRADDQCGRQRASR